MNTITYLKEITPGKKIIGFAFLLFGLFVFVFVNLFGLLFIALGANLLLTEGSEINLQDQTYRSIKSIFGLRFGKWKPCPDFEYISVFKTKENLTLRFVTVETTLQNDIIQLNLFYNTNKHITIYKTQDKTDAFNVAARFKSIFNIDIVDATER